MGKLVMSRMRNQRVIVGDDRHALVMLTADELLLLSTLANEYPGLAGAAERLSVAKVGPVLVGVEDIRGISVRLSVDADKAIPVNREEVHRAIERERRQATAAA